MLNTGGSTKGGLMTSFANRFFMPDSLKISPFTAMQESCTPDMEELVQNAAAACDEYAGEIYDVSFNIASFAINSIAWFSSEW